MTRQGTRRAAGVIVFRGPADAPQVLLLRNRREGHVGFAKGHLDEGEGDLAGAIREVKEELGLVPTLDPAFHETIRYLVHDARGTWPKEVVYFQGELAADARVTISDEHDAAEWLPLAEARERLAHETLRTVLDRAARFRASRRAKTTS